MAKITSSKEGGLERVANKNLEGVANKNLEMDKNTSNKGNTWRDVAKTTFQRMIFRDTWRRWLKNLEGVDKNSGEGG